MDDLSGILGIDIGSVCVSMALVSDNGSVVHHQVQPHQGNVISCLETLLDMVPKKQASYIALTDPAANFLKCHRSYDPLVTTIRAARQFHETFTHILSIGGEKFSLSAFDNDMAYAGTRFNTSCAAGTGSFMDQQALRLNLESSGAISELALSNTAEVPDISTRCAVFAKTDLIHAQQEGYTIEQICDGLCKGMAKNIINTLFKTGPAGSGIIFCGGVSLNLAVKKHLESLLGVKLKTDRYSRIYKAAGAALCLLDDLVQHGSGSFDKISCKTLDDLIIPAETQKKHDYPALSVTLSTYPDFTSFSTYETSGVEADIYENPQTLDLSSCFLGIDVGSTSTKSILMTKDKTVVAGFYTRTASKPVVAVQNICRAIDMFIDEYELSLNIAGCGTTGSGRKISAKIIGADIMPDEITAHARAACHLNPDVDTIIEIGGQDAKFTTMSDGMVTSSVMNTVCAAGTGSFIEEQALRLDCPLSEYSKRTEGVVSPVSSDRCTVFMERDINHFLSVGYTTKQALASVLHSVRDNYLTKVANIGKIGNQILFQGATAKNKALIAAFEQKLKKPIQVSKFCHLTGALGVALLAKETVKAPTAFKGFKIWRQEIPIKKEVCQLCPNHCKITIAFVNDQAEAFGFLCGRDYDTQHYVKKAGQFDLAKKRKSVLAQIHPAPAGHPFTIGIPAALHLVEDLEFWKVFFNELGIRVITSSNLSRPVSLGKKAAGAEFCAPMTALHGHVMHLLDRADYIFLPFYFEDRQKESKLRRQHCYYTQYAPSLISCIHGLDKNRILSPLVKYLYTSFHTKISLFRSLKQINQYTSLSFLDVHKAYDKACAHKEENQEQLKQAFKDHFDPDLSVVLLGRPYTILPASMNAGILNIFAGFNVPSFYQDMLDFDDMDFEPLQDLLTQIHWKYAAQILKSAYIAARTPGLYPVYITSFKCSPDSFCIDYVKQIMETFNKPFLVLELDEHDSSVGYETRIEAGIQAFRNHRKREDQARPVESLRLSSEYAGHIGSRTIIFPSWDDHTSRLIVAILKSEGVNAILLEETEATIKQSLLTNTGQCIPLNAIASGFIHTVETHSLDPAKTLLWLNRSDIACNIRMYPHHIKRIFERHGNGFEKANIYLGELSLFDISMNAARNAYFGYMFGGLIKTISCRIRPYELNRGQTDHAAEQALCILEDAFFNSTDKEKALSHALAGFSEIECLQCKKPKVGIFGDLYIRDNPIINQDLINFIESHGGEAVVTPYYKYVKIIASSYFKKWFAEKKYIDLISNRVIFSAMQALEKKYYKYFEPFLGDITVHDIQDSQDLLASYGILPQHTGESMDNILKIHHIVSEHPDLDLLVQTNPSFCCPALITEAMAELIEKKTGVPIVTITYDISGGHKNRVLVPYLTSLVKKHYPQSRKASG